MAKLKVNDTVKVIAGKAKGTEAIITKMTGDRVFLDKGIVVKKHMKPTQANPDGGIAEFAGSVHRSNVMLSVKGDATRVGFETDSKGNKTRIAKKTGKAVK